MVPTCRHMDKLLYDADGELLEMLRGHMADGTPCEQAARELLHKFRVLLQLTLEQKLAIVSTHLEKTPSVAAMAQFNTIQIRQVRGHDGFKECKRMHLPLHVLLADYEANCS